MTLSEELSQLAIERQAVEVAKQSVLEMLKAKSVEARLAGWSASKIAKTVGVSKRTVQVWTDGPLAAIFHSNT